MQKNKYKWIGVELKKRDCSVRLMAKRIGCSASYLYALINNTYKMEPGKELLENAELFFKQCHTCGQSWPHDHKEGQDENR